MTWTSASSGQQVVEHFGQPAGAGVHPRDVGRQQQHSLGLGTDPPPGLGDGLLHQRLRAIPRDFGGTFGDPGHFLDSVAEEGDNENESNLEISA